MQGKSARADLRLVHSHMGGKKHLLTLYATLNGARCERGALCQILEEAFCRNDQRRISHHLVNDREKAIGS
jgi:hypothetical protein